jgi:hypothetical protein
LGAVALEHPGDRQLRGAVGVGDQVHDPLLGGDPGGFAAEAREQLEARVTGRLGGDVQHIARHKRAGCCVISVHAGHFSSARRASRSPFTVKDRPGDF